MKQWYLDTSAILKLILLEEESPALRNFINGPIISSNLARFETRRNLRDENQRAVAKVDEVLDVMHFVSISDAILGIAEGALVDTGLRAADAIHVATAIFFADYIEGLITYDKQMANVAKRFGIRVESPA